MNFELLKSLCETPGVPGREGRVRSLIEREIEGLFDEVRTDALGSLICRRAPRPRSGDEPGSEPGSGSGAAPTRVMLLAHMDEIGFLVSHVDKKGFVWVDPVGGFDPRHLFSRRVRICTDDGDLLGVMNHAGKPVHTASPEERKKVPEVREFYVDIGLPAKGVGKKVKIGDYVVLDEPCVRVGEKVVAKALDNRVACWLGIEAIRALEASGGHHAAEIVVAFTVQEEVGLRGARTCAYAVKPDIGIGLDVTLACDTPGVVEHDRVTVQGEGFGLHVKDSSFIADPGLVADFESLAEANGIPCQRTILARGGQDGAAAQQAAAGARAIGIVVGTRYVHTVTEMIDVGDLQAARDILALYLAGVG